MTNDDDEIIHQNNGEEIHEDESIDAKAEIARLTDLLQRVQADSVNYRKRMEEERQLLREQSTRNLLLKLLPIIDNHLLTSIQALQLLIFVKFIYLSTYYNINTR